MVWTGSGVNLESAKDWSHGLHRVFTEVQVGKSGTENKEYEPENLLLMF